LEVTVGASQVSVKVQVDVDKLEFPNQRGRRRDQIVVIAALFDGAGRCVAGKFGALTLALTAARWKEMKTAGARTLLDLTSPAGQYELRVAVGGVQQRPADRLPPPGAHHGPAAIGVVQAIRQSREAVEQPQRGRRVLLAATASCRSSLNR
jgi:hypothetical protein